MVILMAITLEQSLVDSFEREILQTNNNTVQSKGLHSSSLNKTNSKASEEEDERFKRRSKSLNVLPEFSAPIGNVSAVVGRDVRLICTVEHLGSYQVSEKLF